MLLLTYPKGSKAPSLHASVFRFKIVHSNHNRHMLLMCKHICIHAHREVLRAPEVVMDKAWFHWGISKTLKWLKIACETIACDASLALSYSQPAKPNVRACHIMSDHSTCASQYNPASCSPSKATLPSTLYVYTPWLVYMSTQHVTQHVVNQQTWIHRVSTLDEYHMFGTTVHCLESPLSFPHPLVKYAYVSAFSQ